MYEMTVNLGADQRGLRDTAGINVAGGGGTKEDASVGFTPVRGLVPSPLSLAFLVVPCGRGMQLRVLSSMPPSAPAASGVARRYSADGRCSPSSARIRANLDSATGCDRDRREIR